MKHRVLCFAISCLALTTLLCQVPTIEWQKTLGGTLNDGFIMSCIQHTSDGGYIIATSTTSVDGDVPGAHGGYDAWLVKLNSNGSIQWQISLGGTGDDFGNCVIQTIDGGYLMAGLTASNDGDVSGQHGDYDAWVVKISSAGNLTWQHTYGGSYYDRFLSVRQTIDGGYVLVGNSDSSDGDLIGFSGGNDMWIVKLNSSGSIVWQNKLGGTGSEHGFSIQATSDGGCVAAGLTTSIDGDVTGYNGGTGDGWIVKLNSSGGLVWQKAVGGSSEDIFQSIRQTIDGGYIAVGYSTSNDGGASGNHGGHDMWVVKLSSSGTVMWEKQIGGTEEDWGYDIEQTASGSYIVVGKTASTDGDVFGNHGNSDCWVVKLDDSGNFIWQRPFGSSGMDGGFSIRQTVDAGYVISGYAGANNGDVSGLHGQLDAWVIKLAPESSVCSYSLSPTSNLNVPAAGPTSHTVDLTAAAGCAWTASSNSSWITITAGSSGSGNGTVSYTVEDYTGTITRNGSLTVAGQDFPVTQLGQSVGCTYVLTPAGNPNIPAAESTGLQTTVTANTGCDWTAVSNSPWISITAGAAGSGNGTVIYAVDENTGTGLRNGSLTVAGQNFSVTQLGALPATYMITAFCDPSSAIIPVTQLSTTPLKICADGSHATRIKVAVSGGSVALTDLQFRFQNATGDIGFSGAFNNGYETSIPGQVTAYFTHPTYLASGNTQYRTDILEVFDVNNSGAVLASAPVRIYRAPITFIHGLYGSQATFEAMNYDLLLFDKYPPVSNLLSGSPLLWRANYHSTSLQRFNINRKVVPDAVDSVLVQAIKHGYSCGKATVIGHSMGGVLARLYLQSLNYFTYRNDMNRLITINTPHYGTQLANYCAPHSINSPNPLECTLFFNIFGGLGQFSGAIRDLQVDSPPILTMNSYPQLVLVPSATLSSNQSGDPSLDAVALRAALYFAYSSLFTNIFDDEAHDLVVPMSSQQSGLSTAPPVPLQWHIGSTDKVGMMTRVQTLLDADPAGTSFSQNGFPQGGLTYMNLPSAHHAVVANTRSVDSVEIVSPYPGQIFTSGDQVSVSINYSNGITNMVLVVTGNGIDPITIDTVGVSPLVFQVPSGAIGTLDLFLLGGGGSGWTASDSTHITISSSIVPDSIACSPSEVNLPLGISQYVQASGFFGVAPAVDLYGSQNLYVTYDPAYLAYWGNGIFQAIAVGNTTAVFSYLGTVDTVYFSIVDDPTALVAAIDYSYENICANGSVTFIDYSQGLITGRQWSFPGGTPASSTDSMPTITYSAPGSYPVTLVTTFVNGIDTLTLNDLVQVTSAPDASFTDMVDSLVADLDGASYQWLSCDNDSMPISGATGQAFIPTANGYYAVIVTDGTCSATSECYFYGSIGVRESNTHNGITVQPNPTHGAFSIQLPNYSRSVRIEVTDIANRIVLVKQSHDVQRIQLQLDEPAGVYLLTIYDEDIKTTFKLVKD